MLNFLNKTPTMTFLLRTAVATRGAAGFSKLQLLRTNNTYPWYTASRVLNFTTTSKEEPNQQLQKLPSFVDSSLRGVGQVIFLNDYKSGLVILGGLAIGDPYLAALAAAGTVSATAAAKSAGLDKNSFQDGLFGYNGCLVGCAVAVFMSPIPVQSLEYPHCMLAITSGLATTLIGGAASPFVAAALKPAMGTVPQWTLAFNFVTLSMLLRTKPFADALPAGTPTPITSLSSEQLFHVALHAPFKGISQIFVVDSSLSGAIILSGIALYSPGLAGHAILGSCIGAVSGVIMGADAMSEIGIGLWGFNSALTSLGVGVFFCPTKRAVALSAGGAAATAVLFGALKTVFGGFDAPCLTLPFCIAMSGCYLLKDAGIPGLILASSPHSPERNKPPTN